MGHTTLESLDNTSPIVVGDGSNQVGRSGSRVVDLQTRCPLTSSLHSLQLLKIHRCRYLEENSCASICYHTCKSPTEKFFNEEMSVSCRIVPDYETFECRFEFGVEPEEGGEEELREVACFLGCPSRAGRFGGTGGG